MLIAVSLRFRGAKQPGASAKQVSTVYEEALREAGSVSTGQCPPEGVATGTTREGASLTEVERNRATHRAELLHFFDQIPCGVRAGGSAVSVRLCDQTR